MNCRHSPQKMVGGKWAIRADASPALFTWMSPAPRTVPGCARWALAGFSLSERKDKTHSDYLLYVSISTQRQAGGRDGRALDASAR